MSDHHPYSETPERSSCSPHVTIGELPLGEQVVTTIKREKIPPIIKKLLPFPWTTVFISVLAALSVKTFLDVRIRVRPEYVPPYATYPSPYPAPYPSPYPSVPPSTQPNTDFPDYYPAEPQCPLEPSQQNDPNNPCSKVLDYRLVQ
jgi:hypothetical protein